MRLRKTTKGRECDSDGGITFVRLLKASFPDGRNRNGWRVEVRRNRKKVATFLAKTLSEATLWARQHWRPYFCGSLIRDVPVPHQIHTLYAAAMLGDPVAFLALADAAEEAGKDVDRPYLLRHARTHQIFTTELPETPEEAAHWRHELLGYADIVATDAAKFAHEKAFENRRGVIDYRRSSLAMRERLLVFYDNNPYHDPSRRPLLYDDIKRRWGKIVGVELLAEASYPAEGEAAGYTIAFAIRGAEHQDEIVRVAQEAIRNEMQATIAVKPA